MTDKPENPPACKFCGDKRWVPMAIAAIDLGPEENAKAREYAERHPVPCPICASPMLSERTKPNE